MRDCFCDHDRGNSRLSDLTIRLMKQKKVKKKQKKLQGQRCFPVKKQEQKEQTAEIKKIESPLAGTVIPLSEVHDEVFASEMMGKGCAVAPEEGKVYAPFDSGKVVGLLDSHHAVGMESTDGVEIRHSCRYGYCKTEWKMLYHPCRRR